MMKKIIEILIGFAFIFAIGFMFGQITENYSVKHTEIKITTGQKYICQSSIDRDRNPFAKKLQDTILVNEIKDGYVLYQKFSNDTIAYQFLTRLSWLQDDIISSLK